VELPGAGVGDDVVNILVVTAVEAERDAIRAAGAGAEVVVGGVGPAAAAAAASARGAEFDLLLCAGIGGGFGPLAPGDIAVASTVIFADLGVESDLPPTWGEFRAGAAPNTPHVGFRPISELGFGVERYEVAAKLSVELADRTGGHLGAILTVSTVTGTLATAEALLGRFPDAVAEGMEGAGVAAAAAVHGIAFGEIRAISNLVGPRDRSAWQVPLALESLGRAVARATDG
jgi:futalosine hydrolase